jgi:hypothetical protein
MAMTAGDVASACSAQAKAKNHGNDENHRTRVVFSVDAKCDADKACGGTIEFTVVTDLEGNTYKRNLKTEWQAQQSGTVEAEAAVRLTFLDEVVKAIHVTAVTCQ